MTIFSLPRFTHRPYLGWVLISLLIYSCKTANTPAVSDGPTTTAAVTESEDVIEQPDQSATKPSLVYQAAESRIWDLIHTKLELNFDWEKQYVMGVASLELKPYFYSQDRLVLDAKGFDLLKISRLTSESEIDLTFQYDSLEIDIALDKEYAREESLHLRIEYVAKPNERVTGGSEAISSDKGLYFINPLAKDPDKPQQIWTQGETESNSAWFPTIDAPNERSTQEMFITVEDRFKTLSNGSLIYSRKNDDGTRTDYWKMDKPHAPYLFMMAIGEYTVVEEKWRDIPLQYWVESPYEGSAKDIFGNTPEMMEYFSQLLEFDYPWSKYTQVVVRDFVSGAMENTTASTFMEDLQVTKRELLDSDWDYIIAHELIHQWFGNLVTCESWSNLPLNEGFANYGEYLWNEYKYGIEEAEYNGWAELQDYLSEAEVKQVSLIRYYYEDREDMFDSHSYAKAGRVMHMLRKYVGDEAFFTALNHYLKENAYTAVEIDDLRRSFEEVTGEDMKWFFDQWFLEPGHPVLDVSHRYENDSLYLYIEQVQDTSKYPIYRLPLYLDVYGDDEIDIYPLIIDNVYEEYSFYYEQEPNLVIFDSDRQLVGEFSFEKSPEEFHYQYHYATDFLSRYFAIYEINELDNDSLKIEVLSKALLDSSWHIRSEAADLIAENEFQNRAEIEDRLAVLIGDEKSGVRASALSALYDHYEKYREQFKAAIRDSSYAVSGVALSAYLQNESEPDPNIVEEFSRETNINLLIPVAEYYLIEGDTTKYQWFTNQVNSLTGTNLYFMLQYFAQYLLSAPTSQKIASINPLEELALNATPYYVRLGAFQALAIISDIEGVSEKIANIVQREQDQRLVYLYEQLEVSFESEN